MVHYLDYAATTPVRQEAVAAAVRTMETGWGNPSSRYGPGQQAELALAQWRGETAQALGCLAQEICFTSCGTEGDNWAIYGGAFQNRRRGKHIITTEIEHSAVLEPCRALEEQGYEVTYLSPDREGHISVEAVEHALREDTVLVSMMLVNNELGSILPVGDCARMLKARGSGALLHCDGVQAFLKVPFTPKELGVDLLTVSGHKIHAPKGVGALYVRKGLKIPPLLRGGGQESGLRAGTEATAQIAAFAAAARAGRDTLKEDIAHMTALKRYAEERLRQALPGVVFLSPGGAPHILPISLPGYKSEVVMRFLSDRGVYLSTGSACHKGKSSHVYKALRRPKAVTEGALRISFSYDSRREDVDALVETLRQAGEELFPSLS